MWFLGASDLAPGGPRRWQTTTVSDPAAAARPDLIDRDFTVDASAVDTRWCGDVPYIDTWEGWLYLATVIDLASRRIAGWAVADHLRTDLVDAALTDALTRRRPASGLVFHSDRGCQYVSAQHARLAAQHGIRLSIGRRGQCWDNAVAESFVATIKTELLHRQPWPTRATARRAIFEYVEGWLQQPPPALQPRLPQPRRLRNQRQQRSLKITTSTLSVESGQSKCALAYDGRPTRNSCFGMAISPTRVYAMHSTSRGNAA